MRLKDSMASRLNQLLPGEVHIVGGGVEGLSTLRFLQAAGRTDLTLRDRNARLETFDGIANVCGNGYLDGIPANATVFRSAGVRFDLPQLQTHRDGNGQVLSQLKLFCALHRALYPKGRIIGVTATMGKGTICTFISEMLKAAAVPHALLGNIGKPMLDIFLEDEVPEVVVLELSSFQLSDFVPGDGLTAKELAPDVAVFGHITIEHLDWHPDQIEYWESKANLANFQSESHVAVHLSRDPGSVFGGMAGDAMRFTLGQEGSLRVEYDALVDDHGRVLLELSQLKVPGSFQMENAGLAWLAASAIGVAEEQCFQGACNFAGLRHRLMWAGEADGVRFYNDSYATRPEATLAALDALSAQPIALILGGSDKGVDFDELALGILACRSICHVALIGATASRLRESLTRAGHPPFELQEHPGLPEAFEASVRSLHGKQGAVLLSPACASFGLFANYKERGEAFLRLASARTGLTF